ncbi:hypothetical protein P43SY_007545 [Pythium insidiosum]|uniref:RNase H type-1 domain-containing protein n=1 Tax=Pythium insidiosum TaxID=114742 RepID=A0AAD5L9X0_PYTIN|nr:hypothetical protein P43SY_007545 [Pythium insidiosum]
MVLKQGEKAADWTVAGARSWAFPDATVNEAEYRGANEAMRLAEAHGIRELIICGDSRSVIQQLKGEIVCRTVGLQVLHAEASTYLLKSVTEIAFNGT